MLSLSKHEIDLGNSPLSFRLGEEFSSSNKGDF